MEINNPIQFRESIRHKLNNIFKNEKRSKYVEKSIFNYCIKESRVRNIIRKWDNKYFVLLYQNKFRTLWFNLNKTYVKNTTLLSKVQSGKIKSKNLAFLTHQEMCPKQWKALIKAKMLRDKNKYRTDTSGASKEFRCRKCNKRETNYYQVQTRSADEPMTTFVTCLNCGNHWRC